MASGCHLWTISTANVYHGRTMRAFLVCAAFFAAAACSSLLDPENNFSFSATTAVMGDAEEFVAVSAAGPGEVRLSGKMMLPTPCYRLSGEAARSGQEIAITVTATSTLGPNQACTTVIATSDYTGTVRELTPGAYRVRVFHGLSHRPGEARAIADVSVVVP